MTPGPWHVQERRWEDDFPVAVEAEHGRNGGNVIATLCGPDIDGNAKAVAAVPAMVEALRAVLKMPGVTLSGEACAIIHRALATAGLSA